MAYADPNRGPPPMTLGAQARAMKRAGSASRCVRRHGTLPQRPTPSRARSGWIIQVGALESESEARQRLNAARENAARYLGRADPFTEVFSGRKTYYRARFAGLTRVPPKPPAKCSSVPTSVA